jgi:phosphotriesterase-related protein
MADGPGVPTATTRIDRVAMTVRGPIESSALGVTLMHEHLYTEFIGLGSLPEPSAEPLSPGNAAEARWNPLAFPDNGRFTDVELTLAELGPLVDAGGTTLVDVTPVVLGRAPHVLADLAVRSGLNVIMGAGWFLEHFHPVEIRAMTEQQLAEIFIGEIVDGVDDSGIRVGILGELGASDPLTMGEAKHLRAAAAAALATGVPVSVHVEPRGWSGPAALDALVGAGMDPGRVVLGHMTTAIHDEGYLRGLLDRGATLAFDFIGMDHAIYRAGEYVPSDYDVARRIVDLVATGYADRIILSQDLSEKIRLRAFGGWGYAHLLEHFVPLLRSLGVSGDSIDQMLVRNPARLLTTDTPVEPTGPGQAGSESFDGGPAHA